MEILQSTVPRCNMQVDRPPHIYKEKNNMSYFPEDIPFMSEEELEYHGIKIPKDESNK